MKYIYIQKQLESVKWHYFLLFGLIFLLNPLCGIFLCLAYIIYNQDECIPAYAYFTLFLLLSFWLGCINMTKHPTSDLLNYIQLFERVPQNGFYHTVFKSWGGSGKEPFYSFITYIGYYVCVGKPTFFIFLLTSTMYFLLLVATYHFLKEIEASKIAILCGAVSLAFFTQYFVLTAHLVRQMLAMSIMMYAIIHRIVRGKYRWALMVIAILTHTSSLLVALFSFIPLFYRKIKMKHIILLLLFFVPIVLFNAQIGGFIGETPIDAMQYAASRYAKGGSDGISISYSLMLIIYMPLLIISLRVLYSLRDNEDHPAYPVIYICLLLMLFVLSFNQSPVIQYRFFYFSYVFIPLLLPLMFYGKRQDYEQIYCLCMGFFFIVRFFLIHNTSGMQFASITELAFMPFPYYFYSTFYY